MNLEESAFNVFLHKVLDKFIFMFKKHAEINRVDLLKVYFEIINRSSEIGHDLKMIALSLPARIKTSGSQDLESKLNDKLEQLVDEVFRQDFLDCALNLQDNLINCFLSAEDVHNFLYIIMKQHGNLLKPSSAELSSMFGFPFTASQFLTNLKKKSSSFTSDFNLSDDLKRFSPSLHFEESKQVFENDLLELQSIFNADLSGRNLNTLTMKSLSNTENKVFKCKSSDQVLKNCELEERLSDSLLQDISSSPVLDFELFCNAHTDEEKTFLSWEQCLGGYLPSHLYTSELSQEEAFHLARKESQIYHSYLNMDGIISEGDIVEHTLDLLTGIPSSTFQLHEADVFRMKQGIHLPNCSTETSSRFIEDFLISGNIFHMLQKWSGNISPSIDGLILTGLKMGVKKCLSLYTEYIFSVKMNSPNLHLLKTDVLRNAQLINALRSICGVNLETGTFNKISKGFDLFLHLRSEMVSHKHEGYAVILAVLLKYTYEPYLNFLNKWMSEGICDDPFNEFQIIEDPRYLNYRDSLFWRFAYIENVENPQREIPPEFKKYSQGILNCGKSIRLLKMCCPQLSSLKFMFLHPLPSLSMIFSYNSATQRAAECAGYFEHMEQIEKCSAMNTTLPEDQRFFNNQQCLSKNSVVKNVLGRWKTLICTASGFNCDLAYSNIIQELSSQSVGAPSSSRPIRRSSSFETLISKNEEYGFSGQLMNGVGILFSTLGYVENTFNPNNIATFMNKLSIDSDFIEIQQARDMKIPSYFANSQYNANFFCAKFSESIICEAMLLSNDSSQTNFNSKTSTAHPIDKCERNDIDITSYDVPSGSFVDKLLPLLLSRYGDSKEEVYSFLQFTSFQSLMVHNFSAVLDMRTHLIEKMMLMYVVHQLGLDSVLKRLRDIYFFLDEGFCQSLCLQLFNLVSDCKTPFQFANWALLNELLSSAVCMSSNGNEKFVDSISINVVSIPEHMPLNRTDFLKLFYIQFEVSWPLNIIVHNACIKQYMSILSVLLEIEYLCWMLAKCWKMLMEKGKDLHLEDNTQYRKILFCRFDMDRFINVLQNSIREQLPGPMWDTLMKGLHSEKLSIDGLEELHIQYLEKALARCFLTEETRVLHELVSVMFLQVYKFCSQVMNCQWIVNAATSSYETPNYSYLCSAFQIYKQYQDVFLKRIIKEALTKKFGRHWDSSYQEFLESISEFKYVNVI